MFLALALTLLGLFFAFLLRPSYFFHDVYRLLFLRLRTRRRIMEYVKTKHTVVEQLREAANSRPHKTFLHFRDDTFTFLQADLLSNQAARVFLRSGVSKGDVVALYAQNSPMFIWMWLGLAKIGCVGAFINFNLRSKSLLHCLNVSGAKLLVAGEESQDAVVEVLPVLQEQQVSVLVLSHKCSEGLQSFTQNMDRVSSEPLSRDHRAGLSLFSPVVYIYTSGTTGLPKAAVITHFRLWVMTLFHVTFGRTSEEVLYINLPLYHSVAFIGVTGAIYLGSTVALRNKFSVSNFWSDCRKYNVDTIVYIGETMRYLCNAPKSPSDREHNVKLAIGNGIRADVWREFLKRFGDVTIREFYGATEGNCSFINYDGKIGAVGRESFLSKLLIPVAFIKYDVDRAEPVRDAAGFCVRAAKDEPGLLVSKITVQSPFSGYVGDLKQTESKRLRDVFEKGDVYFNTGDMFLRDQEGFVYFLDRVGDTFRWKGENVATNEVADILNMAECIQEANVYGVTVPGQEGRAGMASVILTKDQEFDSGAVFKHVENLLPSYARPLFIRIQESLDVTGTFKHQKGKLRDEGFDPNKFTDALYFYHTKEKNYVPLTVNIYEHVVSGKIKV